MIRLWVHLGRDLLEHHRYTVTPHDGKVVSSVSFTPAFMANVESQLGLVERKRSVQIVDNEKGGDTVQHIGSAIQRM
jgi:hypothetical protein